ncbi:hypothetical protein BGZ94_007275 [Podila epigama]|nr:hypothetical protein BGZ94_007275 [Podila epigama]
MSNHVVVHQTSPPHLPPPSQQASPSEARPHSTSSRVRTRPLSVTIDLRQEPPGYDEQWNSPPSSPEQHQYQHRSESPHFRLSSPTASSLSASVAMSPQQLLQQHEQALRPPSVITSNDSIALAPILGPAFGTFASSSVPRRPFLEEDELPEYLSLSESGLPFKIPASESLTYTVTPSQGPEEFLHQHQQQQQSLNGQEVILHQPESQRRGSIATARTRRTERTTQDPVSESLSGRQTYVNANNIHANETNLQTRRQGAWTLEYWLNDTIMYLCYLMDPKHSATTMLLPRTPDDHRQQQRLSVHPNPEQGAATSEHMGSPGSARSAERTENARNTANTGTTERSGHARDMFNAFMTSREHDTSDMEAGGRREHRLHYQEMERVPTGHLRGRPPPLARRVRASYQSFAQVGLGRHIEAPVLSGGDSGHPPVAPVRPSSENPVTEGIRAAAGGSEGEPSTTTGAEVQSSPASNAQAHSSTQSNHEEPPPSVDSAESTTGVIEPSPSGEDGSVSQDPQTTVETNAIVAGQDTLSLSGGQNDSNESPSGSTEISSSSPRSGSGQILPLPPIHLIPQDVDSQADTSMRNTTTQLAEQESNSFNNALSVEFFKSPTFALVSAEDPQTWIWWSSHHEHNLQKCRQEGPHEEVLMWWRTRTDYSSKERKEARRKLKQWRRWQAKELQLAQQQQEQLQQQQQQEQQQQRQQAQQQQSQPQRSSQRQASSHQGNQDLRQPSYYARNRDQDSALKARRQDETIAQKLVRFIDSKFPRAPHYESMEITMRVRGLYYAWREEEYESLGPLPSTVAARYFGTGAVSSSSDPQWNGHHQANGDSFHDPHHPYNRESQPYYQEDLDDQHFTEDGLGTDVGDSTQQFPTEAAAATSRMPQTPVGNHSAARNDNHSIPMLGQLRSRPRMFTLIRDDSLLHGERVKGGPIAEIWIGEDDSMEPELEPEPSPLNHSVTTPTFQSLASATLPRRPIATLTRAAASATTAGLTTTTTNPHHHHHHHGIEGLAQSSSSSSVSVPSAGLSESLAGAAGGGGGGAGGAGSSTVPYFAPLSSTSDGASSITSNNGNTVMTEVSAATGGPLRSTAASTFMAPVPSGRSFASSAQYNVSMIGSPNSPSFVSHGTGGDSDGDGEGIGIGHGGDHISDAGSNQDVGSGGGVTSVVNGHSRNLVRPGQRRTRPRSYSFDSHQHQHQHQHQDPTSSSSFPPGLYRRKCIIRVLRGLHPEIETFILSTGPRLPELFELYTDQSVPGPSRATFICSVMAFALVFIAAFISIAVTKGDGGYS